MKKLTIVSLLILMFFSGCKKIQEFTDDLLQTPARKIYERDFREDHSIYQTWNFSFEEAKKSQLSIPDPFVAHCNISSTSISAYSYNIELEEGEKVIVHIQCENDTTLFFIDFFQYLGEDLNSDKSFSAKLEERRFEIDVLESGMFKFIVQPELGYFDDFSLKIYSQPTLSFPVSGKDNQAIKSFWGAKRDAGRRSHEGVDIFAERGTPVAAATDGIVSRTGNYGLGGKQVWLRDGLLGKSLYYAHLDSVIAKQGQKVNIGDTLGLVGNTGNAQTTAPHLHFGIYGRGGAVNPYPFIQLKEVPEFEQHDFAETGVTDGRENNLRLGPNTHFDEIALLPPGQNLTIVGKSGNWLQITTQNGEEGFIYETLVR